MKNLLIVLLVLGIISFAQTQSFAQVSESDIRDAAIIKLSQIQIGQKMFTNSSGGYSYPPPSRCEPKTICWQGQILSSLNIAGSSSQDLILQLGSQPEFFCPQSLLVSVGKFRGDVRFRCRRQGAVPQDVWCFAYRCEHASPAGCKQKWRLRIRGSGTASPVPLDCFDVGNTGICASAPATITAWGASCFE